MVKYLFTEKELKEWVQIKENYLCNPKKYPLRNPRSKRKITKDGSIWRQLEKQVKNINVVIKKINIEKMPNELIQSLLLFLPIEKIIILRTISKDFKSFLQLKTFWNMMLKRDFGLEKNFKNPKKEYINRYKDNMMKNYWNIVDWKYTDDDTFLQELKKEGFEDKHMKEIININYFIEEKIKFILDKDFEPKRYNIFQILGYNFILGSIDSETNDIIQEDYFDDLIEKIISLGEKKFKSFISVAEKAGYYKDIPYSKDFSFKANDKYRKKHKEVMIKYLKNNKTDLIQDNDLSNKIMAIDEYLDNFFIK